MNATIANPLPMNPPPPPPKIDAGTQDERPLRPQDAQAPLNKYRKVAIIPQPHEHWWIYNHRSNYPVFAIGPVRNNN
jgi:hypothetical protein